MPGCFQGWLSGGSPGMPVFQMFSCPNGPCPMAIEGGALILQSSTPQSSMVYFLGSVPAIICQDFGQMTLSLNFTLPSMKQA